MLLFFSSATHPSAHYPSRLKGGKIFFPLYVRMHILPDPDMGRPALTQAPRRWPLVRQGFMFSLAGFHVFPFYAFLSLCHGNHSPEPHDARESITRPSLPATTCRLCFYVMGTTAQSRMHATRPAYDPHCLQRHILEHLVPNTIIYFVSSVLWLS